MACSSGKADCREQCLAYFLPARVVKAVAMTLKDHRSDGDAAASHSAGQDAPASSTCSSRRLGIKVSGRGCRACHAAAPHLPRRLSKAIAACRAGPRAAKPSPRPSAITPHITPYEPFPAGPPPRRWSHDTATQQLRDDGPTAVRPAPRVRGVRAMLYVLRRPPQDAAAQCAETQEFLDPALERSYEQYVAEHTWPVYRWHLASILLTAALAATSEMLYTDATLSAWVRLGVRSGPMLLLMFALYTYEQSRSPHVCFCAALQLRCCVMMLLGGWTSDRMLFVASSAYSFVVLPCLSPLPFKWQVPAAVMQVGRACCCWLPAGGRVECMGLHPRRCSCLLAMRGCRCHEEAAPPARPPVGQRAPVALLGGAGRRMPRCSPAAAGVPVAKARVRSQGWRCGCPAGKHSLLAPEPTRRPAAALRCPQVSLAIMHQQGQDGVLPGEACLRLALQVLLALVSLRVWHRADASIRRRFLGSRR
jgi:hypothetical protein